MTARQRRLSSRARAWSRNFSAQAGRKLHIIDAGLAAIRAGEPGIPQEVVERHIKALIAARFDKNRKRPEPIPVFATDAEEREFWATHDIVEYFSQHDFLEELDDSAGVS
jgi:hypothetical protein